jgi:hypothetical protein
MLVLVGNPARELAGDAVAGNWLPPEFRPKAPATFILVADPMPDCLTEPSTAVANCRAKPLAELREPAELTVRLPSGPFISALVVAETILLLSPARDSSNSIANLS